MIPTLQAVLASSPEGLMACTPDGGALALSIGEDGKPPEFIHLAPYGTWRGYPRGGELQTFVLGPQDAGQILAYFTARGLDLVIDYQHQTVYAPFTGTTAPAAGWIDRLEVRPDGVWGHVKDWTAKAAKHLLEREYRYLSPVIDWHHNDERSGKDVGTTLHSAALTNTPFLDTLVPVVASVSPLHQEPAMNPLLILCLAALGLGGVKPEDATKEQVEGAIGDQQGRHDAACSALGVESSAKLEDITTAASTGHARLTAACSALGLAADASLEDIQAAATRVAAEAKLGAVVCSKLELDASELADDATTKLEAELSHSGYVPVAEHTAALSKLGGEVEQLNDDQLLERARLEGKLTPPLEGWAKSHIKRDRAGFLAWMSTAPGVPVRSSGLGGRQPPKPASTTLSDVEQAACTQMGLTAEEFLASKKEA